MNTSPPNRPGLLWPWLIWTAGFLSFPIAGIAGGAVASRAGPLSAAGDVIASSENRSRRR
jgi:hypothetical protein